MVKKVLNIFYRFLNAHLYTVKERIIKNGGKIGRGVFIGKDVLIDYDYAFLLEMGDGAVISARTIIELHDSSLPNVLGKGKIKIGRVKIGERAYIGVNSVVLPGIEIGAGAIVGACSLVNRSIPKKQVWGGVPVKFISTVDELIEKRQKSNAPNLAYVDWMGELEKSEIDYRKVKKKFLDHVQRKFYNKFQF